MPEDPIAAHETAALTRRVEEIHEQNAREFGIIKSELTTLQLKAANQDQKADRIESKLDELVQEMRAGQAQVVQLLTQLVGRDPSA